MINNSAWRLPLFPLDDLTVTGGGDQARAAGVHMKGSVNEGVGIAEEMFGGMPTPLEDEVAKDAVAQQALAAP